jgi:hypothetical protein
MLLDVCKILDDNLNICDIISLIPLAVASKEFTKIFVNLREKLTSDESILHNYIVSFNYNNHKTYPISSLKQLDWFSYRVERFRYSSSI